MKKYRRIDTYPAGLAIVTEVDESGRYFHYLKFETGACSPALLTVQEMGWPSVAEFLAAMASKGRPFEEVQG